MGWDVFNGDIVLHQFFTANFFVYLHQIFAFCTLIFFLHEFLHQNFCFFLHSFFLAQKFCTIFLHQILKFRKRFFVKKAKKIGVKNLV